MRSRPFTAKLFFGMRITKSNAFDKVSAPYEFSTLSELAEFITKSDWSPFVYQTPHEDNDGTYKRNTKSFCAADIFALDIDDGLSMDDAIATIKRLGLAAIVAPSRSHQKPKGDKPPCDRYRIIFVLDKQIILDKQVKAVFYKLKELFPAADDACKDAARLFFKSNEIAYIQEGSALQVPDFIQETTVHTAPTNNQIVPEGTILPLSRKSMNVIFNGAEQGTRNDAIKAILHDAIQQQYTEEQLLKLLRTSPHTWLYDDVALNKISERYKNFTPTHAPRVPAPTSSGGAPSTKPTIIPLNQIKLLLEQWLVNNDVAVSYNRTMYMDGKAQIVEDVIRKVVLHLASVNLAINEGILTYALQEWIDENRQAHLDAVKAEVDGYDPKGVEEARRFLKVLTANITDLDVQVLRHMVWCTKRRLNNLRTKYEMMLVFTGGQGAGKSHALREYLFKPFGDLAHTSVGFETLSDSRENRLFSDHYIAMFDEMSGAHKADMERVKQIITSGIIKQRRMGTTSHDSLPMNCAFFGTANMPLEMLIKDTTGMRRFWEIVVDSAAETSKRWADLKDINIKLIWQSADHNDEVSPIEPYLQELQVKQENIREKSIVEWLLEENVVEVTDNLDEYTSAIALTNVVNISLSQNWSARALAKEWKKAGLSRKVTSSGVRYGVKIVDLDVLHSLRTKYNMRIGSKDKEGYAF